MHLQRGEILLMGLKSFQKMESTVLPVAGFCIFVRHFNEFKIALG